MAVSDRIMTGREARQQLFDLANEELSRIQLMDRILEISTEYLGVEHGHVVDIDESENRWKVAGSTDPPGGAYPAGLQTKLEDSYCRRTIQQSEPLALHDAKAQGWVNDHAYQLHQLDTYLGMRIDAGEEPFGTLCFVSKGARERPFSEEERIFVEIAAEVLGQGLSRTQHQKEIMNRDQVIRVLNRVLRHNLRNDLNVVSGYADLLEKESSGRAAQYAETVRSIVDDLIQLGEKARDLDTLTRSVPVPRPMDIVPLVKETVAEFESEHPQVSVEVDQPNRAMTLAAPQLSEALLELLTNAAKYAGDEPSVAVSVQRKPAETVIAVQDNGPGLPPEEQRVLTKGSETPLEHGSGLGLFLVYWVISMLDGEIDVEITERGTTIRLHLVAAGQLDRQKQARSIAEDPL